MLLEARGISKRFRSGQGFVEALSPTSFDVQEGEFISIVGPSGSGKSTLMNLIGLLDHPSSGELLLDGRNCARLKPDQVAGIRNRRIGFVFQSYQLLARQSVLKNVELPLVYAGVRRSERRRRAARALEAVELSHRMNHKPSQLSGGEQQRVAIARAIVADPAIILADEPTGALDSVTGQDILHLLQDLNSSGRTIVMVTHDAAIARCATRIFSIRDGALVSDCAASPDADERLMEAV